MLVSDTTTTYMIGSYYYCTLQFYYSDASWYYTCLSCYYFLGHFCRLSHAYLLRLFCSEYTIYILPGSGL